VYGLRLPLWKYFTTKVTDFRSDDVDNKGYGQGKLCLAAVAINEFINCVDWIHFDVTGIGMMCKD
jgi:cytosol aminopeptidase